MAMGMIKYGRQRRRPWGDLLLAFSHSNPPRARSNSIEGAQMLCHKRWQRMPRTKGTRMRITGIRDNADVVDICESVIWGFDALYRASSFIVLSPDLVRIKCLQQ